MKEEIISIQEEAVNAVSEAADFAQLDEARVAFLGKKGKLTAVSAGMRSLSKEEKPVIGELLNVARTAINQALDEKKSALEEAADLAMIDGVDVSLPGSLRPEGNLHPMTIMRDRATQILRRLGFALADGPEIETEFHCFDALNTPEDHPARNDGDTFYFDASADGLRKLLRTHTSSVQVRTMESQTPPVRIIAPGSAYRRDEIDATHLSVFTQLEGLFIAEDVRLSDLKGTLEYFFQALFGEQTEIRFRPHFFPFTEPSFEIDVKLKVKGQEDKWIEVAGCGMVDPAVLQQICNSRGDDAFSPEKVTGFAFGMGIDRLAMIQWGIRDIRYLIDNDSRFLKQFA